MRISVNVHTRSASTVKLTVETPVSRGNVELHDGRLLVKSGRFTLPELRWVLGVVERLGVCQQCL